MNFSSDAMADFEGLLEVNRKICQQQMAEKASPTLPTNCAVLPYTKTTRAVFFAEGGACCFLCSGPKMGITDFPCRRCRGSHRFLYGYENLFIRLFLLLGGLMGGRSRRRCDRLSVTVAFDGSCQHQRLAGAHRADHLIQHRGRENDRAEERRRTPPGEYAAPAPQGRCSRLPAE